MRIERNLIISFVFLALFLILGLSTGYFQNIDNAISEAIPLNSFLNYFLLLITGIAGNFVFIALSLLLAFFLLFKKRKKDFVLSLLALGGGSILTIFAKLIFQRERPENSLIEEMGFAFPSGHAVKAVILLGLIIYLFKDEIKSKLLKNLFVCANILLIFLIGLSRIYLGVHWMSDVIGGFLLGLSWLLISVYLADKFYYINHKS